MVAQKKNLYVFNANPASELKKFSDGDVPVALFKKDVLSVGQYTHPVFGWNLDITVERLNRFVAAFNKMKENGVQVEVPIDHSFSAEDNLGYVVDMFVEGDTLFNILEIRTQGAIDTLNRNSNVSVAIEQDFIDGAGNAYGEAIIHTSVVQQPVVPDQDGFERIAASKFVERDSIFVFSMEKFKDNDMEKLLEQMKELLGAGDDLTAETLSARISEKLSSLTQENQSLQEQIVTLTAKVDEATKKASTLPEIGADLQEQIGTTAEEQAAVLLSVGYPPATVDKLKTEFIGKPGARMLSTLRISPTNGPSVWSRLFGILKDCKPVDIKESTGPQVLSRTVPGGDDDTKREKDRADASEAMCAGAGCKTS
jgi:hypothetical protein